MDNQQAKTTDLAWLAGLLDGEAAFMLRRMRQKKGDEHYFPASGGYIPAMKLGMCDQKTVQHVADILDMVSVGKYGPYLYKKQPPSKDVWELSVHGLRRCRTLFEVLRPYAFTKQPQIALLSEFIESRLSHDHRDPPNAREAEIVDIFRNPYSPQRLNARPDNRLRQMQGVQSGMV